MNEEKKKKSKQNAKGDTNNRQIIQYCILSQKNISEFCLLFFPHKPREYHSMNSISD